MSKFILCAYYVCLSTSGWCQLLLEGKVISKSDGHPLSYANIGILNSPVGTIANEDGTFTLMVPPNYAQKAVLFSALGYAPQEHLVQSLVGISQIIALEEKALLLKEVVVRPSSEKKITAVLGSRVRIFGTQYGDSVAAGAAMALKVRSNSQPTYYPDLTPPLFIQKASLWIHRNYLKQFKVRVRIMDIDEATGLPGNDLLRESVVITSHIRSGWIETDLSNYHLSVPDTQFFVACEWIMDDAARFEVMKQFKEYKILHPDKVRADTAVVHGEEVQFLHWDGIGAGVWFGAAPAENVYLNGMECFYRTNSHARWEKSYSIVASRITVTNKP